MPAPVPPYEHDHENEVVLFGQTNFRNQNRRFGIKTDDRRRHVYVIGKTGMGKTTLLENMVLADIYAGHGLAYIDPHGDSAQKFLDFIPPHRINDVVYFNPADMEFPVGFNILETVDESQKHLVASGLMGVFKKIWPDVWSSRMEYILLNTIMALLDFPGSTLLGINRLLSDEEYRGRVVSLIQDPVVKTFWVKEFASFSEKYRTEAVAPLQNKVGQFLSATIIRNIVAQVKSTINVREIMDTRKIFIVNLSKGSVGEENSRLLGAMIITRLQLAAMERVDMPEKDRQDFYLYVDEFQNFATQSFANILSEARKYRLALIVAHQYIEQLEEEVRAAVFGNVGTIITFRVGAADAAFMENEFMPRFTPEDLVNLKKYEVYLKLMIDGASSEPFSANTLAPIAETTESTAKVIKVSRERYAMPRKVIEEKVIKWAGFGTVDTGQTLMTEDEESAAIEAKIEELTKSSPDVGEMASPAGGGGFGGGGAKKKKKAEFQVPCSVCGKISELTFEPDWSKPWFCKEHLEMKQKGMLPKAAAPAPTKVAAAPAPAPAKIVVVPAAPAAAAAPKPTAPVAKPAEASASPETVAQIAQPAETALLSKPAAPPSQKPADSPVTAAAPASVPAPVVPSPVVVRAPAERPPVASNVTAPQSKNQQQQKSKAPPPAKAMMTKVPEVKPVSLGALPSREDAVPKKADKAPFDRATQKPLSKPQLAATAEQVAGIPASSHKPRIVMGGTDDDAASEIKKTVEKPTAQREAEAASTAAVPSAVATETAPVPAPKAPTQEPPKSEPFRTSPPAKEMNEQMEAAALATNPPEHPKSPEPKPPTPPQPPAPASSPAAYKPSGGQAPSEPVPGAAADKPNAPDATKGSWQPGQVIKF